MQPSTHDPADLLDVLRVLLLLQASLFLVAVLEALVFAAVFGPAALGAVALNLVLVIGLLALRRRAARLGRRGRRALLGLEVVLLAGATIDTILGLAMAGQLLGLVPAITRIVLPITIVVAVRRLGRFAAARGAVPGSVAAAAPAAASVPATPARGAA